MVNVVRAYDLPRQFVHQIIFFVGAFCRSEHADGICAELIADLHQFVGCDVEGSVPVGLDPIPGQFEIR